MELTLFATAANSNPPWPAWSDGTLGRWPAVYEERASEERDVTRSRARKTWTEEELKQLEALGYGGN